MSTPTTKTVTAEGWTDLEATETTVVVQNTGRRSVRIHIGASAPSDALRDTSGVKLTPNYGTYDSPGGNAETLTLGGSDNVYARVLSSYDEMSCEVEVWQ